MMEVVAWARNLAGQLLAEPLPVRWAHVQGVARAAESISHIVGDDGPLLISAAWLHDVGYAPTLAQAGLHQLDGARYLRDAENADSLLCRLVANHSYAIVEAGIADWPLVGGRVPQGRRSYIGRVDLLRHDHQPDRRCCRCRDSPRRDIRAATARAASCRSRFARQARGSGCRSRR